LADQLGELAKNVQVSQDGFDFDIPDNLLFIRGTSIPTPEFIFIMDKIKGITTGLADAEVRLTSALFIQSVKSQTEVEARRIAQQRLDLVKNKISGGLENTSSTVAGSINVREKKGEIEPSKLIGFLKLNIRQKPIKTDGSKARKLEAMFGEKANMNVYEDYVQKVTDKKKQGRTKKTE